VRVISRPFPEGVTILSMLPAAAGAASTKTRMHRSTALFGSIAGIFIVWW